MSKDKRSPPNGNKKRKAGCQVGPEEFLFALTHADKNTLVEWADQSVECFRTSDAGYDPIEKGVDTLLTSLIHAEFLRRGMVVEALDLFCTLNAIRPLLADGETYSEYVASLVEALDL